MKRSIAALTCLTSLLGLSAPLLAQESYPFLVPNGTVHSCDTCHYNQDFSNPPRSPKFRVDFRAANYLWGPALAQMDSDGDGVTNGQELGDPEGNWRPGQPAPGDRSKVTIPSDPNSFILPEEFVTSLSAEYTSNHVLTVDLGLNNSTSDSRTVVVFVAVEIFGQFYFLPNFTADATPVQTTQLASRGTWGPEEILNVPFGGPVNPPIPVTWYAASLDQGSFTLVGNLASAPVTLN